MELPTDLWQDRSSHWQSLFIREHFLPLGHAAWAGYTTQGRGLVSCMVTGNLATLNWRCDVVPYRLQFVPLTDAADYLRCQGIPGDRIERLITAVQTYSPERDLLLFISSGGHPQVTWLRNLAIAPLDCHLQVRDRWAEFNLEPTGTPPQGRYDNACGS